MTAVGVTTPANIRALREHGAIVLPAQAGEALTVGDLVYWASDGDVMQADANAGQPQTRAVGIVVASYDGETAVASGAACSVCVFGPIAGFDVADITPGALYYVSDTAGKVDDAAGTYDRIIGWGVEIAGQDVLFFNPQTNNPAS